MVHVLMAALLIPMAVQDLIKKRLNLFWMTGMGVMGIAVNIIWNDWGIHEAAAGSLVGVGLIICSKIKSSIGSGDGVLFLAAGLICGWEACLFLLTGSLVCSLPVGLFFKFVRNKPGSYEIPFVPCVLAAWSGSLILQIAEVMR